jgi:hypothetical protein
VRRRRSLTTLESASLAVIALALPLLIGAKVLRSSEPTGPVYSTAQVMSEVDAAAIRYHTNPQSAEADQPNSCAVLDEADRTRVREVFRTQIQVTGEDSGDIDLSIIGFDTENNAVRRAEQRRATAEQQDWLAVQRGNLYVELQAPRSSVPPEIVEKISAALARVTAPASPTPVLLRCR